ncbi:Gfo/Idh/MocA family protein [Planctomycetota bacterium]
MNNKKYTRREFIKKTVAGAAGVAAAHLGFPAILRSASPNETIGIGVIGFGIRARQMMCALGHAHPQAAPNATGFGTITRKDRTRGYGRKNQTLVKPFDTEQIRAVCDIYQDALKYASEMFPPNVKYYDNYRKVLDDPDIDCVMIFTPDHWHVKIAIDACKAGKDVFIEKCPTHNFTEGVALKKAVEENKRVLQLNESGVHSAATKKMRDIVRSGALGRVHLVRICKDIQADRRLWDWPIPSDLSPKTINWKEFLGSAPYHEFDPKRVIQWRCYWDYGTGVCGDLFSHTLAVVNTVMDIHIPKTAVASGGTYELNDYMYVPDLYHSIYEYPDKGLTVNFSSNFAAPQPYSDTVYYGTDAAMTQKGSQIHISNKPGSGKEPLEIIRPQRTSEMSGQETHFHEFFDAIRTRGKTTCDMHMCFGEDLACHMGTEAFHRGRKVTWDPEKMEII